MLLESARGMSGKKSDRAKMDGLSSAIYVCFLYLSLSNMLYQSLDLG